MKKRDIVIDADHIAFLVAKSKTYKSGFTDDDGEDYDCDWGEEPELDLEPYKRHFKAIVTDYVLTAEVESIAYNWTIGKTRVIMSDKTNFRYEIYPEYKDNRSKMPEDEVLDALKKWARKEYTFVKNCEADDVVAYYVRKGALGFTTDKDLFKGVEGIWYNCHYMHRNWIRTSKASAEHFFKCQALAGDGVDGIPAIKGVALRGAEKLLDEYGDSWSDILQIYLDKGYDEKYMQTMIRLVAMNQWSPKKGIKLWNLKKELKKC